MNFCLHAHRTNVNDSKLLPGNKNATIPEFENFEERAAMPRDKAPYYRFMPSKT